MKIAFLDSTAQKYNAETPYGSALGGTQSAACYLAASLAARGHEVSLVGASREVGRWRGVESPGAAGATREALNRHDVLVVLTHPMGRKLAAGASPPRVLWQHNDVGAQTLKPLADPAERAAWDGVAFVSDYQRRRFVSQYGLDGKVLRNAVSPSVLAQAPLSQTFLDRGDGPELVYASAPGRGLDLLLIAFPSIRAAIPNARLRIFSDFGLYQQHGEKDHYRAFYELARALDGVEHVGSVSQAKLAEGLRRADILAYPTNFVETSCIVLMDAGASGALPVVSDFGALPETAAGFGVLAALKTMRSEFIGAFAEATVEAIRRATADPAAFARRREQQIEAFRRGNSWDDRAAEWESWLEAVVERRRGA